MIDYIHKDLYWQDSIDKQLKIELEDGTILDNSMIYSEEFELEESLCSEDELRFGACEASCVKFRIFSIPNRLVGQKITISEVLGGQTDSPMQIGKYKIASAKPTADRDFIDIVAYDFMYDIIHADVASWYNNQFKATASTKTDEDGNETTVVTYNTTTLKKFRDSFFLHFGIDQEDVTLPNDNMVVSKTIEIVPNEDGTIGETLSGSMVIEAICEINGCFGHINRDGKFEYVTLQQIAKELFPADDLFPRNNLYPSSDNTGVVIYNWQYEATEYEDFDVQPITQVQIIQEDNDIGMTVGADGNKYVVNSNFLTYSLSDEELETVGTNLLSVIEKAKYTPIKANVIGNPCVTVGDIIKIVTNSAILYSYVINRTLKGCQSLTDEFESNGEEYRSVDVNSTSGQIKKLQGRSNVLERSIDETRSTIANVEKGLKSEIKQTAEGISASVTETLKSYSTTEEMNSAIEVTKDSIESTVSKAHSLWELPIAVDSNEVIYGYGTADENGLDPETSKKPLYLNVETGLLQVVSINHDTHEFKWDEYAQCEKIEYFLQSQIDQNEQGIQLEVKRATKAEGELQSSIDVQAQEIVLKVDANGRIVEVSLTGDPKDGTEFTVYADNISLEASDVFNIISNSELNLTSNNITIASNNFSVDENGRMSCDEANVTGDVFASRLSAKDGIYIHGYNTTEGNWEELVMGFPDKVGTYTTDPLVFYRESDFYEAVTFAKNIYASSGISIADGEDITCLNWYTQTTATSANAHIGSGGKIKRVASSSKRYKKDITEDISEELNPENLYDVTIYQYRYKNGYLSDDNAERNQIGFIVENLEKYYPISVEYIEDENGDKMPETWNDRYLIPAMLKLIQEQKKEIDDLKEQVLKLSERIDRYEQGLQ